MRRKGSSDFAQSIAPKNASSANTGTRTRGWKRDPPSRRERFGAAREGGWRGTEGSVPSVCSCRIPYSLSVFIFAASFISLLAYFAYFAVILFSELVLCWLLLNPLDDICVHFQRLLCFLMAIIIPPQLQ